MSRTQRIDTNRFWQTSQTVVFACENHKQEMIDPTPGRGGGQR